MKKKVKINKKEYLEKMFLITFSIFLTYFTIHKYLPQGEMGILYNMMIFSFILIPIWFLIISKLRLTYCKLLNFFILKFREKKKIKDYNKVFLNWIPSGVILTLVSIILVSFFIYYTKLNRIITDRITDYSKIATHIHSTYFPIAIVVSLILVVIFQFIYLVKKEKIRKLPSFISTILSLLIIIIIVLIIRQIMHGFISYL